MEKITLDPKYEKLLYEVNDLQNEAVTKIVTEDMLRYQIIPSMVSYCIGELGLVYSEDFSMNLDLFKSYCKRAIYKDKIKNKKRINEKTIERELEEKVATIYDAYLEHHQELMMSGTVDMADEESTEALILTNGLYKNLILDLDPRFCGNGSQFEDDLLRMVKRAYVEMDVDIMMDIDYLLETAEFNTDPITGDTSELNDLKKVYKKIIKDEDKKIKELESEDIYVSFDNFRDDKYVDGIEKKIRKHMKDVTKEMEKIETEIKNLRNKR